MVCDILKEYVNIHLEPFKMEVTSLFNMSGTTTSMMLCHIPDDTRTQAWPKKYGYLLTWSEFIFQVCGQIISAVICINHISGSCIFLELMLTYCQHFLFCQLQTGQMKESKNVQLLT